jgi:hypothetical protein
VDDHIRALEAHTEPGLFPIVLANDNADVTFDPPAGVELVRPGDLDKGRYRVVGDDLIDTDCPWRHDSAKLARSLMALLDEQ